MARKSVAAGLRKGLQREDQVLEARFAAADSVASQIKAVSTAASAVQASQAPEPRPAKVRKPAAEASDLVVRESLSMPAEERDRLDELRHTLQKRGMYDITRSQLLRAGIVQLAKLAPEELEQLVGTVERRSPGRKPP